MEEGGTRGLSALRLAFPDERIREREIGKSAVLLLFFSTQRKLDGAKNE